MGTAIWAALLIAASPAADRPEVSDQDRAEQLFKVIEKLKPLAIRLPEKPRPSDWLAQHPEKGQSFKEYLAGDPTRPTGKRNAIWVQPLGDFTATQRKLVTQTADFMAIYFHVPAKVSADLPLKLIPAEARRKHPQWGMDQILTTHVLEEVLLKRLPKDAAAYIAFTATDLWPGEGWNFVFGEASDDRVGVWSFYRFGDPEKSEADYRLALLRTLKLATHETGHMFSMAHCTAYQCNLCGSNNLPETDRHPLAECPECLAKLCWATRADPLERYGKLADFCKDQGLKSEEQTYRKLLAALAPDQDRKP
jgi:archaemetzincin